MSVAIQIQLSPQAISVAQKWNRAPQEFPQAIKRGMNRALQITSGRIQQKRLTGKGPFPVTMHRLGERTHQLKLRTRATPAQITSVSANQTVVTGAIGSSVKYAAVHEFGGKRAPERAPFRTGIKENAKFISDEISGEVIKSLK